MIKIIGACDSCSHYTSDGDFKEEMKTECNISKRDVSRIHYKGEIIGCSGYSSILNEIQPLDEIKAHIKRMEIERNRALENKSGPGLDFTNGVITAMNWVLKKD